MKILLSVFACTPNTGSEGGVGWRWAIELARAGHSVVALTDETRREAIVRELAIRPVPGLTFVFYRPTWLARFPLNSSTAQLLFSAWQYSLLPFARRIHKLHTFEVAIHLTYGVFRTPSFLGFLGIPFIFGPVGGGEDAPWELKRGLPVKELIRECLRSILIGIARINPLLLLSLHPADLILTKTMDTKEALPINVRAVAKVHHEIGIDCDIKESGWAPTPRQPNAPLNLLFAGRLLGWKGVHLALRSLAAARSQGKDVRLTIVGSGALAGWLRNLAEALGIHEFVIWHSHMPQADLFTLYQATHAFLFPSLHDSSGNVVLEALSFGLPVICLNLGGPATLVDKTCATIVAVQGLSQEQVVCRLADAIIELYDAEPRRVTMSASALIRAKEMTWASRPLGALKLLADQR